MFSAGHLDIRSSHCSPHFPIPGSFFTHIPANYLADLWPSGRLLEPASSLQSLMDSLVNSFTVIISIPSSLCLTYFLYRYSPWERNLSRCSLEKVCSCSFFYFSFIRITFPCLLAKKQKSLIAHVQLVLWGKPVGVGAKEVWQSRWLQRRRVMWGKVMQVPWGQWEKKWGADVEEDVCPQQWQRKVHSGTSWISINCQVLL